MARCDKRSGTERTQLLDVADALDTTADRPPDQRGRSGARARVPAAAWILLGAAALVGVAVRVVYLAQKPFWRDEAWVALLVDQPLSVISDPARPRPVPIGFVALVKLTAAIPRLAPEVTFRLVPLAVGLAVLPALAWLGWNLGASLWSIVIATWLAAGMPALVYYSRELKPYGIDLLVALLVPSLALRVFGRAANVVERSSTAASGTALALTLLAAPWLSFGALFPILATLTWGWVRWWRPAAAPARRVWIAATLLFVCSFVGAYELTVATQANSAWLKAFWAPYRYATDGRSMIGELADAVVRYVALSTAYLFPACSRTALALAAVGLAAWPPRTRWFLAWLWAGSAAAAIALALADYYLLAHGRLLLFAAPPLLLLAAAGLERVSKLAFGRGGRVVALSLAVGLALIWSGAAIRRRLPPYRNDMSAYFLYDVLHDVDALIQRATEIVPAGDPVLISQFAGWPFTFYRRGRLPGAAVCVEPCPTYTTVRDTFLNGIVRRGWVLLIDDEVGRFAEAVASAGMVARPAAVTRGAQLWELTRPAPSEPAHAAPDDRRSPGSMPAPPDRM